jgi:hypothetical protein
MPAPPLADWRPVRPPRRPTILRCSICGRDAPNEYNRIRGWQQTGSGLAITYRCRDCSSIAAGHVSDDVPDGAPVDR